MLCKRDGMWYDDLGGEFMGLYFNPNNVKFVRDIRSKIYVDKTRLLSELNQILSTNDNCISVSHARRFGKTQAANMIEAYYSCGCDSKELFSQYEISSVPGVEDYLNKYNVIHLDVSSFTDYAGGDVVDAIIDALVEEFSEEYQNINYALPLHRILYKIYQVTKKQFVIIIDEWDCVIRNYSDRQDLVHKYMQFLHSLFKSMESAEFLALGYVTGILPIKKVNDESALNNFREYTMLDSKNLTQYYGFTEDEVKELCEKYDMSFDAVKNWYNGYLINGQHMYNPNSVSQSMSNHDLCSYWKNTSSFGTINNYITLNFDGLKESIIQILSGEHVPVKTGTFSNDLSQIKSRDDSLTALVHLGYLAYDEQSGTTYLPNYEVREAYNAALSSGQWKEIADSVRQCEELLRLTIDGDEANVAGIIELAHEAYTSVLTYNNENSLSCVISMAYFTAPAYYTLIRELPSGKGFADIAFVPKPYTDKPALLVELKYDKSVSAAIDQIKEKRYTSALVGYKDVILVGINYDKDGGDKKHSCVIEKWSV